MHVVVDGHDEELVAGIPWGGDRPSSFVVLCGTVPAIGGIRPAEAVEMELEDPLLGRTLLHQYRVTPLPVEG